MPHLNYIGTVYKGVDFARYTCRKNEGKYFIFSGRIVKEKGILSAIEISKRTQIPLKIAEIITDQQFFDNEIKPYCDNTLISFEGNLNYSQLVELLQGSIATICMAEWDEPFRLSALDSLACGVPVIASRRGALPELVYDPNMGILVDSVDTAIQQLRELHQIKSQDCMDLARSRFSREAMAKGYQKYYEEILSKLA